MDGSALIVTPLNTAEASLEMFGGKGRSLARMAVAGLPVPNGFLLSTRAYQGFVETNHLQDSILQAISEATAGPTASVESASDKIQSLFESATLPTETARSIVQAYTTLGEDEPAVAVRSSATAEDLPGLSFAGQQDTLLNVRGQSAVLQAIRRCWASLWTARAISYRLKMNIDQRTVAMGVVVQVMVPADVAGILFTANPATGNRSELVVNASYGLGEAVVSGHVTPDTYVLDREGLQVKETRIGDKEKMIVSADQQGTITRPVPGNRQDERSLPADILGELALLSLDAVALFDDQPQDIEWAVVGDKVWLLQSRPITNLPPPPLEDVAWDPPSKRDKLIRRQVVENMPDPLSTLFDELYLQIGLEDAIDQFLVDFGMRVDIGAFIERPFFLSVNGYAYSRGSYRLSWRMLRALPGMLYAYIKVTPKILKNLKSRWRDEALPAYLKTIQEWKSVELATASDQQLLAGISALASADANYWFNVSMMVGGAKITDGFLNRYLRCWFIPGKLTSGVFLRGFPSKTLEAQVDLEAIAARIQQDPSLCEQVRTTPINQLLEALRQASSSSSVVADIDRYFEKYGHQVYNLDFVEPTQGEDPAAVLVSLRTLINSDGFDTPGRQARLVQERDALVQRTRSSLGPVRRWLFQKLLGWAQAFGPCREDALFYMGAAWSTLRRLACELGERLVAAEVLARPDDVYYLEKAELIQACSARSEGQTPSELSQHAQQRRELREARKRLHPPGIIPEGSRWRFGPVNMSAFETQKRNTRDADILDGFAVSPGTVTGVATVVLSPADFEQMQPDTILVCPTTTPAWTPLFAQAAGLVTDIGGILAHGSIVAREYGIPAVLGTGNGTQRIVTGQRITVDGDSGKVILLR